MAARSFQNLLTTNFGLSPSGYTGSRGDIGYTGSAGTGGGGGSGNITSVSDQINNSTGYLSLPSGTTAERPGTLPYGSMRYNTTTGMAEVYTVFGWGSFGAMPPTIVSVSPASFNGEQGTTITITGTNFTSDAIIKFVTSSGTEYGSTSVSFVDSTTIAATTPRDFTVAEGPLDVKLIQGSGTVTGVNLIDTGGTPVWQTTAGTLASLIYPDVTTYNSSVSATDPDANSTITYSVTTGSLPGGAVLNNDGTITGSVANPGSSTNTSTFTLVATDNAGNQSSPRQFNIIRQWRDGSTEALAATSASAIYNLGSSLQTASANGKYWIKLPGQATAKQVYCLMNSGVDSGGWMLSFYKATSSSAYTFKQLWYSNASWNNTTYTADATNYPVLPDAISFGGLGFTKQMFNNQHPSWITNKGDYHWYNLQTDINWSLSGSITVNFYRLSNSTTGTTPIYNRQQAWSWGTDNLTSQWAWWADSGNGGLCGGANQCATAACPTAGAAEGCHTNSGYPTLIFVK